MKSLTGTPVATIISASNGVPFNMRLVRKGDTYGRDLCLTHDKDDALVEFYDARYRFEGERGAEFGQFVSRYYLSTLCKSKNKGGLNLDGGVDAWTIDADGMALAYAILRNWTA
jgi:hypothetical protein